MKKIIFGVLAVFLMTSHEPVCFAEEPAVTAPAVTGNKPPAVRRKRAARMKRKARAQKRSSMKVRDAKTKGTPHNSFEAWCRGLKERIMRSQARQNQIVAVASVRGAEKDDAPPLYWKGRAGTAPVESMDLKELDAALDTALAGDSAGARTSLEGFMIKHSDSPLADDAREALRRLDESAAK